MSVGAVDGQREDESEEWEGSIVGHVPQLVCTQIGRIVVLAAVHFQPHECTATEGVTGRGGDQVAPQGDVFSVALYVSDVLLGCSDPRDDLGGTDVVEENDVATDCHRGECARS